MTNESQNIEYKEAWRDEYLKSIAQGVLCWNCTGLLFNNSGNQWHYRLTFTYYNNV